MALFFGKIRIADTLLKTAILTLTMLQKKHMVKKYL